MIKVRSLFLLLAFFLVDNVLTTVFGHYTRDYFVIVPYSLLLFICMMMFFENHSFSLWIVALFGLFFDLYYGNMVGLYTVYFTVMAYGLKKHIVPIVPFNFLSLLMISSLFIFVLELVTAFFMRIAIGAQVELFHFLIYRVFSTLVYNGLLLFFYYFIVKFCYEQRKRKIF